MSLFHRTQQQSTDTMDNGAKLITVAHPKSPISEQFRTIRPILISWRLISQSRP